VKINAFADGKEKTEEQEAIPPHPEVHEEARKLFKQMEEGII
jgi:hypothetical protein